MHCLTQIRELELQRREEAMAAAEKQEDGRRKREVETEARRAEAEAELEKARAEIYALQVGLESPWYSLQCFVCDACRRYVCEAAIGPTALTMVETAYFFRTRG